LDHVTRCRWKTSIGISLSLVLTAGVAGASSSSTAHGAAVPGGAWETAKPAAVGLDAAKLDELATKAEAGKSHCFAVVRHGKLAVDRYFAGTGPQSAQNVFSMTKSVTSTLIGIAQDDGDLKISDPASKWISEWRGTPSANVTIRDLLSNDSGREWSLAIDYGQLIAAPDRTAFAVGLTQASPPGTVWAYNNSAIQTLARVLQGATGQDPVDFAQKRLFGPLGMTHTKMSRDRSGTAQMFEGVDSTCQDMARFGLLMLHHGAWGKKQIVSSAWVADATGKSSQKLNAAYGYLWWVNRRGPIAGATAATSIAEANDPTTKRTHLVPGAPNDMFWALGLGNQVVQVDPGSDTVVVRLGTAEAQPTPPTFGRDDTSKVVTEAITR
jgi:CubicO group peptidase (beta-lactamase class C family)